MPWVKITGFVEVPDEGYVQPPQRGYLETPLNRDGWLDVMNLDIDELDAVTIEPATRSERS